MRKITQLASKAFWNNDYFKLDNTMVLNGVMQLYKTNIATLKDGVLILDCDGYRSVTTKERLNGVLMPLCKKIYQVKGKWYLHDGNDDSEIAYFDGMEIKL